MCPSARERPSYGRTTGEHRTRARHIEGPLPPPTRTRQAGLTRRISRSKSHQRAQRSQHARPQLEAQCTTTRASEDDTTSETGTTYTRASRVELQPRRTARNRGDTQSLGYLKIRPTKKTLVPGPQGDKGRTTHACRPQSRAQPRGAHPGYRRRGRRARQDAQLQATSNSSSGCAQPRGCYPVQKSGALTFNSVGKRLGCLVRSV